MRLQAVGEIVEAAVVGYPARDKAAGEIVDFVGHGVPGAVDGFFGVGAAGRFARVALFNERVKINHFGVAVEGFEDGFAGNAFGEGGYGGVGGSFGHGGGDWEGGELMDLGE